MNLDEKRVFSYLKAYFGENVVFEPDGKIPPDFLVNTVTAVEARRLNQHFFNEGKPKGLEQISFPMFDVFENVLKSFDSSYQGNIYWVSIDFERPIKTPMYQVKRGLEIALKAFLVSGVSELPQSLQVTDNIEFTIYPSSPVVGRVFRPEGGSDNDAGGWVIPSYVENIGHCISEKSSKVRPYLAKYQRWWLYLVDHMGWGLDAEETQELISSISDIGVFDGVFIIGNDGISLLASISK